VRIEFYGQLAEAIARAVELPQADRETVAQVRQRLIALYPGAAEALSRPAVRACLNDCIVDDAVTVPKGAALAFLPPLSGG
jgi:molybdopterin converting factor small subunit